MQTKKEKSALGEHFFRCFRILRSLRKLRPLILSLHQSSRCVVYSVANDDKQCAITEHLLNADS